VGLKKDKAIAILTWLCRISNLPQKKFFLYKKEDGKRDEVKEKEEGHFITAN